MTKRDIRKKFDAIVAFAEVAQFLDTPVKRYSSGMYVRLAFAVAAHLEPEILVVDEVLAVGDADFQKKCLGKMNDVSLQEGRTVLFVSHNMEALLKLCSRGILLSSGQLVDCGDVKQVVSHYLDKKLSNSKAIDLSSKSRELKLPSRVRLIEARVVNKLRQWSFPFGQHFAFDICIDSKISFDAELGMGLFSARDFELASWTNNCSDTRLVLHPGLNVIRVEYTDLALLPGQVFYRYRPAFR